MFSPTLQKNCYVISIELVTDYYPQGSYVQTYVQILFQIISCNKVLC